MSDSPSKNEFVPDVPGTAARTAAEARIEQLRNEGGIFVEAVRATRMPMVVADPTLPGVPIVFANASFLDLSGYSMDEVLGQAAHFMNGEGTDRQDATRFTEALDAGCDIELECVQYRKDGTPLNLAVFCRALTDDEGRTTAHFLSYLDVTRRATAERRLLEHADDLDRLLVRESEKLRESEDRYRLIVEGARDYAIFTVDVAGRIDDWHEGAETVFGWTREEVEGQLMDLTFTPEDRAKNVPDRERKRAQLEGSAPDVRWHMRKDGSRVFIDGRAVALLGADGALRGFLKIGQDVTDRRRSEQLQRTLLAELQHRVRNVLAMVISLVRRSAVGSPSVEHYRDNLMGRLVAMARTQALLTRSADAEVDLETLICDEIDGQGAQGRQVSISGPAVTLAPKAAELLTLAIHELTTNAIKYGALETPEGRVDVSWTVTERARENWLLLNWVESGVSITTASATRGGFGTELITRRVPSGLRGQAELELTPDGLHCRIDFPLVEGHSILQSDAAISPVSERGLI